MFGMGWPELLVIGIVAVFVFGPDRLPDLAKQAGQFVRTTRRMMENAKRDLSRELGEDFEHLRDLNLRELDPREVIRRNVVDAMESEPAVVPAGKRPLRRGELPPFDPDAT